MSHWTQAYPCMLSHLPTTFPPKASQKHPSSCHLPPTDAEITTQLKPINYLLCPTALTLSRVLANCHMSMPSGSPGIQWVAITINRKWLRSAPCQELGLSPFITKILKILLTGRTILRSTCQSGFNMMSRVYTLRWPTVVLIVLHT